MIGGLNMEILSTISGVFFSIVLLLPAIIYGAMIGNRVINNEAGGKWYKKIMIVPIFVFLGVILLPITLMLVIFNWDDFCYEIEKTLKI